MIGEICFDSAKPGSILYQVVTKSRTCPAGNQRFKTKKDDGTWEMIEHYANGGPIYFDRPEFARELLSDLGGDGYVKDVVL